VRIPAAVVRPTGIARLRLISPGEARMSLLPAGLTFYFFASSTLIRALRIWV
jgi:hypothetical protein